MAAAVCTRHGGARQVTVRGIMEALQEDGVDVDELWRKIEGVIVSTFVGIAQSTESRPSGYCHNKLYGLDVMMDAEVCGMSGVVLQHWPTG